MKKLMSKLMEYLFPEGSDIRVKSFNILAVGGAIVSVVTAIINLSEGMGIFSALACFSGVFLSLGMMIYTKKTGDFRRAMLLTVVVVFIGLFSVLFFMNGGYHGGFPYFFVFGIVYTAFLLDGVIVPILIATELVWYACLCVFSFSNPLSTIGFTNEKVLVTDVIVCESIVAVSLATTMYYQIREYRKKQKELNRAIRMAKEASRAKSDFLAKMSHDIRTPLNTIMAMNEMIVSNTSSATIREWVNDSNISAGILLSMIDDMLDLTRIEAGRVNVLNQPWDTRHLFDETARIWKLQANREGLDFIYRIDDSVPDFLLGDEGMIRKITNNLLSNSVKYTKSGNICFSVSKAEELEISVKDTGVGIAGEYLKKIFKPFERGVQDIYRETSGSGLGLAIVKELVDAMGGSISCHSILNEGTEFVVSLPQDKCPDRKTEFLLKRPKQSTGSSVSKKYIAPNARILIVDDNSANRKVIDAFLEPTLIQTDDVESGFEALEMIDIKDYDLILMDLRMPKMDGAETLAKIKEEYPGFNTPILVLTADIMNGVEERLLSQGFAGFLSKPVSSAKLLAAIAEFIPDKTVSVETEEENVLTIAEVEAYQDMLIPFGIDLKLAMEFNAGNTGEFLMRARLFVKYADAGIKRLSVPDADESYYLQIHSLKSGAKGVGAYLLAEFAEAVELRRDDRFRETVNPVLTGEYERVCKGLRILFEEVKY